MELKEPWEEFQDNENAAAEKATGECFECGCLIHDETAFAPEGHPLCPACAAEWIEDKTIWLV